MKNLIIVFAFFTIILGSGCCDILCSCDDTEDFATAILNEDPGYDFSIGAQPASYNLGDGGVIGWCPIGQNPDYKSYDQYLWWRTIESSELQKDYGDTDLSSITKIPNNWDSVINPLLEDHCYVIKCNDGYVKLKVINVRVNAEEVEVRYQFSNSGNF